MTIRNSVAVTQGGGIALLENAHVTGSLLHLESSSALEGGCFSASGNASMDFEHLDFVNCTARTDGGSLALLDKASAKLSNLTVNNSHAGGVGAGILVTAYSTLSLSHGFLRYVFCVTP